MSRYDRLLGLSLDPIDHTFAPRDAILYALGVGASADDLDLVYEQQLRAIPSLATVLAYPGNWYANPEIDLDGLHTVHASERFELVGELPVTGRVRATSKIVELHDRGPGRGAFVISARSIRDVATDQEIARVTQRVLCRADGGLGGPLSKPPKPAAVPQVPADKVLTVPTARNSAVIYRLMGDDNPLHVDPDFARRAGFPNPILHGLSTYGHVCRVLMQAAGGRMIRSMDCRFTAPVYPGDALSLEIWDCPNGFAFRAHCRGQIALDGGEVELAEDR